MCLFNLPRKRKGLKCFRLREELGNFSMCCVLFWIDLWGVHAVRYRFDKLLEDVLLVDTPSFYVDHDGPDADAILKEWMDANTLEGCWAISILYAHDLRRNPYFDSRPLPMYISAFQRTCREDLTGYTIYVVKTLLPGVRLPQERIEFISTQVQYQAEEEVALMHPTLFDGKPEDAWDILQTLFNKIEPILPLHLRQWIARWDLPSPLLPSITQ
ncbi:hypothetical protein EDC04DRAFT_2611570 [Pisolithus marmoratus]|nr:hypothetical protein EDC04DRAFT_2611570 [Pisolithus marmoratus]